jgi:pimeloyl-ACP methyl ester carboxylesterase
VPNASSPPVLLLHGLATSAQRTWRETGWIDLLGDLGRTVLAPDLLGHGEAPKPHDPEAYADLEDRVLDVLPEEPVDAVGFSLGARTLLVLASEHPERFRRLVVAGVGANLFRDDDGHSEQLARVLAGEAGDDGDAGSHPTVGYFQRLAAAPDADPLAVAALLRRPRQRRLTDDALARITLPVLVVLGDADFAGPADPLVERLPDVRLQVLRGVDHFGTPKAFSFLDAALPFLDG